MVVHALLKILGVIGLIILFLLGAGTYFYKVAISRQRKDFLKGNADLSTDTPNETWTSCKEWINNQTCKKVNITAYEGLVLCGHYISAAVPTLNTVVLIHGYTGKGLDMASFAKYYYEELGFNILMPDCRGHGESQGNYIGFGWHDRIDILNWINYIIKRNGKESKIVLHGISMGGGTVLMTSGEKLPSNVKFIVSDCAYTSVKDILGYQMRRMYKLPKFPLLQVTSLICKLRSGYFFSEASAIKQVQKSKTPILFIHGNEDNFVPTNMVHELFKAAKCEKQLLIVDKARHGDCYWIDTKSYKQYVSDFVERYVV